MQLPLDLSPPTHPSLHQAWLDITPLAEGTGFSGPVEISQGLHDALEQPSAEYDQHLYDALWLAHFQLSLDPACTAATFLLPHKEGGLRLRVELQPGLVRLGLIQDFQEIPCPITSASIAGNSPSSTARIPRRGSRTVTSMRR